MKKLVSLLLSMVMLFTLTTTAFASNNNQIIELCNDENVVVIQEITSDGITIATNNKNTNLLTIEKYDGTKTTLLSKEVIDLNILKANSEIEATIHFGNGNKYQHTFTNREYDIWYGNPREWKCRSGGSIVWVNETSRNEDDLRTFAECVEGVNEAEFVIIAALGGTLAATAIAAFLSGGTAAGIAAAGGGTAITTAFVNLNSACNKADLAFDYI